MFHFNIIKSAQATALLLKQPGKDGDNYYKLIKLLYLAERESLQETGRSITGDRTVAMPHGPALSHICDLIRGEDTRSSWAAYFKTATESDFTLKLVADPGDGLLCRYEIEKLQEVARRYRDKGRWAMKRLTHELPEYKQNDPGGSSKEIPVSDILGAAGKQRHAAAVGRAAQADLAFARVFRKRPS